MKTLILIVASIFFLVTENTLMAQPEVTHQLTQSELSSINAIWKEFNNVELCFTSTRTMSANEEVTTRTEKYILFRPYFSCEVVIKTDGIPNHKYKYTFDGDRYYLLIEDQLLEISSSISEIYLTGLTSSPLTLSWFPLLFRNPGEIPDLMGGSDFVGSVLSNFNLRRLSSRNLELADGDGITIFRFSGDNFSFPHWEKQTKDGSRVDVNIAETVELAFLPKYQIPKRIHGVDRIGESGVVITSITELTSLSRVTDLRASDFRISPDNAKVVWDDDLQSFINSEK